MSHPLPTLPLDDDNEMMKLQQNTTVIEIKIESID